MFGKFYGIREKELQDDPTTPRQLSYASTLLAGVLNRANALQGACGFCRCTADAREFYDDALDALQGAVESFLDDIEEVRIRGRRARLFGFDGDTIVDPDLVEDKESLERIGGELVPHFSED